MRLNTFKSRDKPRNSAPGQSYGFLFGGISSGKSVNERSAMQMTAVYVCVRILSEATAGLPLHLYRCGKDGSKEKALDHSLYRLLHDEPNPEMTSFIFRETLMTHLLLWGCWRPLILTWVISSPTLTFEPYSSFFISFI